MALNFMFKCFCSHENGDHLHKHLPSRQKSEKCTPIVLKCLLTAELLENIWLEVMAYIRHDLKPNIFPSGPTYLSQ